MIREAIQLFNLVTNDDLVEEFGWINDNEFCVWIYHRDIQEFMERIVELFGNSICDEGGIMVHMFKDMFCINLCDLLYSYLDIEEIFSKEEYQH